MDPREILPPEIWELVFDNVEDPQDWLNLYRASASFQELVGDKRTTALFPQVLPLVIKFRSEALSKILLGGLRLASRSWKATADKMLENAVTVDPHHQGKLERAYKFHDSARISSFLERFDHSRRHAGRNPFVGRFASFKYDRELSSEALAEYNNLAIRLLSEFGAQLKTLCVDMHLTNFDDCASRVQSFLEWTPNLDSLSVHFENPEDEHQGGRGGGGGGGGDGGGGGGGGDGGGGRGGGGGGGGKGIRYIERESLPLIRNLKLIRLTGDAADAREVLLDLYNAVVRLSCNNPNSLESIKTTGIPSKLLLLPFPNVKSAEVVGLTELEDCSNLARASWPLLSKLTVDHSFFEIPLEPLFRSIEHFKATLTSLKLVRPLLGTRSVNKFRLDLPHLKQLELEENPNMSLNFLTSNNNNNLANLEVLTISSTRHYRPRQETHDLLAFLEWAGDEVGRSGLWEGQPKLTQISLNGPFTQQFVRGTFVVKVLRHVATRNSREFRRLKKQRCFRST